MRIASLILAATAVSTVAAQKGGRPHDEDPPTPPELPKPATEPDEPSQQQPGTIEDPDPYLAEPEENPCFGEGPSCEEIADVANDVLSDLLDLIPGPTSSSSSIPLPTAAITSAVPVYDVATSIIIDADALGVFDASELAMYSSDPLCFWANLERQYVRAATATATSTSSTSASAPPTTVSASVTTVELPGIATNVITYTAIGTSEAAVAQTYLFESLFPYWISSIYSPVSNAPNATASLVTLTTTCAGLDGAPAFATPFVARATPSTTAAPGGASTSATSSGAAAAPTGGSKLAAAAAAAGAACVLGMGVVGAL